MLYSPTFFTMAFANFSVLCSFGVFFLFPLFISQCGGRQSDIGIIMGAFVLASVLCRPAIAHMIDRIGRKRSFTIGSFIMTLLPLTYLGLEGSLSTFFFPLLLIRIAHGVGMAISITASFTYALDIVPENRRNEGIGMYGISGLLGTAVGPMIAEALIGKFGFDSAFWAASAMAGIGFLAHLPLKETFVISGSWRQATFFGVLRKSRVLTVAMLSFLFGFGLAGSNGFVSPFISEHHFAVVSLYYVSYSSAAILTRLIGGRFADQIGEDRIIPYALTATSAGLLSLIFINGNAMLVLSGAMTGLGHGFLFPSLVALAMREEPAAIRGKITGVFTGGLDTGCFIGSIALGYIGEWAGYRTLFLSAGLVLFMAVALFHYRGSVGAHRTDKGKIQNALR